MALSLLQCSRNAAGCGNAGAVILNLYRQVLGCGILHCFWRYAKHKASLLEPKVLQLCRHSDGSYLFNGDGGVRCGQCYIQTAISTNNLAISNWNRFCSPCVVDPDHLIAVYITHSCPVCFFAVLVIFWAISRYPSTQDTRETGM